MNEIHGNLNGIRDSVLEQMKQMYDWPIGKDEFLPVELAQMMAQFSADIKREISLYISRNGDVLDVSIGDHQQVSLKEWRLRRSDKRLSCVRCIHTHPMASCELSDVDLTAIRSLLLDAICAIGTDEEGRVTGISAAFLGEKINGIPQVRLFPPVSLKRIPQEAWMNEIEISDQMVLEGEERQENTRERAILVGIESEESLDELAALCESAGGEVVGRVFQKRLKPEGASYIGTGRAAQLSLEAQAAEADLVIVDDELTGVQLNKLEEIVGTRIVDRTTLILDIFAKRAKSGEGKLQVELAQLNYNAGRLIGLHSSLSRLAGGIGTRGPGESKLEIDRRRIRERINDLKAQLKTLENQRAVRRKSREKNNQAVVALVGYTNTGKSTLMNRLSTADVYVKNELFATLDAVSRRVELSGGDSFILVDSVGFIRKLPTDLVEAFHSTLEEAVLADILLIVSDASSPDCRKQHEVVEQVLNDLGATHQPRIDVLNKCDALLPENALFMSNSVQISALNGDGVEELLEKIKDLLRERLKEYRIMVPFTRYALLNDLRANGRILSEEHEEEGTLVSVLLDRAAVGHLLAAYGEDFPCFQ